MKNWYSTTLTALGVALAIAGTNFFLITATTDVPLLPFLGLAIIGYGIWIIRQR
jgi:hypothetical protein